MNESYNINDDVTNIKLNIVDIESNVKTNRDNIQTIKESQTELAKETVDIIEVMAAKTDKNQINTMNAIEDLKKSQKNWWKNLNWFIKLIIVILILSYIAGSYLAFFTNMGK